MKPGKIVPGCLLGLILCSSLTLSAANTISDQVLVTVGGDYTVTSTDLKKLIKSSPFYTQFNTMTVDQQASIRGDLLKRLVSSRLLGEEAKAEGLDRTESFKQEVADYRTALLYKAYMSRLRQSIKIPEDELAVMRNENKGNADAYSAAKVIYTSSDYKLQREQALHRLEKQSNIKIYKQRIKSNPTADTILLEGDHIAVRYGDIVERDLENVNFDVVVERLRKRRELLLISQEAEKTGINVDGDVAAYVSERLPSLMIEKKEKLWVPGDKTLKAYYDAHPDMGVVPERWHVGQIVLKTKEQAEQMHKRIESGDSLFTLAGQYSIDDYGKSRNGDMGWIQQGKALPELNAVLKDLPLGELSPVIKTGKGFHIVKIIDAQPGSKHRYEGMKDKIKQTIVTEKLTQYLQELQKKYQVDWQLVQSDAAIAGEEK